MKEISNTNFIFLKFLLFEIHCFLRHNFKVMTNVPIFQMGYKMISCKINLRKKKKFMTGKKSCFAVNDSISCMLKNDQILRVSTHFANVFLYCCKKHCDAITFLN